MKKYIYLKNKNFTVSLKNNRIDIVNQILNAININLSPQYTKIINTAVEVESIYSETINSPLHVTLDKLAQILFACDLELTNFSNIATSSSSIIQGLSFSSAEEKQVFVDKWFLANTKIVIYRKKLRFKLQFLDDLVCSVREMLKNNNYDKSDLLVYLNILPVVDNYEDELTVEIQSKLDRYIQNLRRSDNVG